MSKRGMLWMMGLVAFGFTYAAAVNIRQVSAFGGYVSTTCQGMWNFTKWFGRSCSESLPPRLGVLALGAAVLIVCGYFAEKNTSHLPKPHFIERRSPTRNEWFCKTCGFLTQDPAAAMKHWKDGLDGLLAADGQTIMRLQPNGSSVATSGNAHGFGSAAAPATASTSSPTVQPIRQAVPMPAATPESKTCPDCAEDVRAAARKCRFCGYMFESQPATQA